MSISVSLHNSKTTRPLTSPNFLCILPMAVTLSSSAVSYVLPVLSMTLSFHIMALWCIMCIPKWQQIMTSIIAEITTKLCSSTNTSNYSFWSVRLGQRLLSKVASFTFTANMPVVYHIVFCLTDRLNWGFTSPSILNRSFWGHSSQPSSWLFLNKQDATQQKPSSIFQVNMQLHIE